MVAAGLLLQFLSLLPLHPLAFIAFVGFGVPIMLIGVAYYVFSLLSHTHPDAPVSPATRAGQS